MIVINLTINITGAPGNWRIDDVVDLNSAIVDAIRPRPRPGLQHQASCPICKDWTQFYSSPAKARQGLAGHQSWCRRKK